jgi:hypothetical protein
MDDRPFPQTRCILCSMPLSLQTDLAADENGKAVHTECYVKRIAGVPSNPSPTSIVN